MTPCSRSLGQPYVTHGRVQRPHSGLQPVRQGPQRLHRGHGPGPCVHDHAKLKGESHGRISTPIGAWKHNLALFGNYDSQTD